MREKHPKWLPQEATGVVTAAFRGSAVLSVSDSASLSSLQASDQLELQFEAAGRELSYWNARSGCRHPRLANWMVKNAGEQRHPPGQRSHVPHCSCSRVIVGFLCSSPNPCRNGSVVTCVQTCELCWRHSMPRKAWSSVSVECTTKTYWEKLF